jgi:hypothetical protein
MKPLVLILVLIVGGLLLIGWQREQSWAVWEVRAKQAEQEVTALTAQANSARADAQRWMAYADSLRGHRDTVLVTRWRTILDTAYVGPTLTLAECREALGGLRSLCQQAVDSLGGEIAKAREESDGYRNGLATMATSDSLRAVAVDSLQRLVQSVPVPKKFLGFLPVPKLTVGLGCAGATKVACGLMAGVGFTF